MKTLPVARFLGINNRLPDFALSTEAGRFVRAAENVDLDSAGAFSLRPVESRIQPVSAPHSLFKNHLVRSSALYQVTLPAYSETLAKVLASNNAMSYAEFNGSTYFSNGTDSGRIATDGSVSPWAIATPSAPALVATGGSLPAGKYMVVVSYINNDTGEEGGMSARSAISLAATGGIRVSLPGASDGATHANIYVSEINGGLLFHKVKAVIGTLTYDITTPGAGREATERYEAPLPAGTRIFFHNGRLCSVSGKTLYYGLAHRPGYYDPVAGRIPFTENITIAVPTQGGVYVAADKTYFLQGADLEAVEFVREVLPYGAVQGTEFTVPTKGAQDASAKVGWFGNNGVVVADAQGMATTLTENNIDLTAPDSGISAVFESGGYRRVVSCGWCVNLDTGAATTYQDFEFTSISNGYGTKADGVYLVEGTGKADAFIDLGAENFGAENIKTMPAVYLGYASESPLELAVTTPEHDDYRYEARSCSDMLSIHRIDPGKGLRANWFNLALRNLDGADFTLASISFAPAVSSRRI